ncbi:coiled-coil domain-containing protein 57 isoform X3 [Ornithorhynchus anatinus]|uniref:coiled-coil domain-containing protein 57 isoform X3 n=1 Tax=Ornithorhynchus anatinus TaxID=9258 RepID=UPI0010A84363|nr:coiled-coil domain-containing protein 57 isoform X3 [Ornithorhynchus anatinus]
MLCPEREAEVMLRGARPPESGRRSPPGRQEREARERLVRLEEDFLYNLRLLDEQDRELRRLEAALAGARGAEEARRAEASELKIQVAKLQRAVAEEAGRRRELQESYRRRLREHWFELERVHGSQNGEIDLHVEQYERLKRELETKVQELDGELALQKQELLAQFEAELKKREHEFRLKAGHANNVVLTHQLKVKLLNKELEAAREAGIKAEESLRVAEATAAELEKEVKGKDWEMKNLAAVKDARIKQLEGKLHSLELTKKKEEEIFQRKHEELDRFSREKEAGLSERVRELEAEVRRLRALGESQETEQRRARRRQADVLSRKDAAIARLREEVAAVKSSRDAQVVQMSKEIVSKDLQVQGLQEEEVNLKAHLLGLQQDIDSCRAAGRDVRRTGCGDASCRRRSLGLHADPAPTQGSREARFFRRRGSRGRPSLRGRDPGPPPTPPAAGPAPEAERSRREDLQPEPREAAAHRPGQPASGRAGRRDGVSRRGAPAPASRSLGDPETKGASDGEASSRGLGPPARHPGAASLVRGPRVWFDADASPGRPGPRAARDPRPGASPDPLIRSERFPPGRVAASGAGIGSFASQLAGGRGPRLRAPRGTGTRSDLIISPLTECSERCSTKRVLNDS